MLRKANAHDSIGDTAIALLSTTRHAQGQRRDLPVMPNASRAQVRQNRPFLLDAFVLLPDHLHCLMTLPTDDSDISTHLRLIKTSETRHYRKAVAVAVDLSEQVISLLGPF
ncbi:MAG: hypothetical protein ACFBSG_10010 [Leptolyngbyaceae cyanobacterium]